MERAPQHLMRSLASFTAVFALASAIVVSNASAQEGSRRAASRNPHARAACGDVLAFQVLLDGHGFSPGEIDGQLGTNTRRALEAFQQASQLKPTGTPDCQTWSALGGNDQTSSTTEYTITQADAAGPFGEKIPEDLLEQAKLPALNYTSLAEELSERFHASPATLTRLNPDKHFEAGTTITVPDVKPFDYKAKPAHDTAAGNVKVEVTRAGSLRVIGGNDQTIFFAPVTSGSSHDPLPIGNWHVQTVAWMPDFHYNPDLFWDAKATDTKATIKPGPNNPVGVVWIDLSREHYGLHGTPEPSRIGYTQSHGCVRLTNWDAARVAALVGPNTPVIFK
ncbi:MAG TPA: L,D-transpeptidase [Vicinamibacterales bacterium]